MPRRPAILAQSDAGVPCPQREIAEESSAPHRVPGGYRGRDTPHPFPQHPEARQFHTVRAYFLKPAAQLAAIIRLENFSVRYSIQVSGWITAIRKSVVARRPRVPWDT